MTAVGRPVRFVERPLASADAVRPAGSPTGWLAVGAAGLGATVLAGRALGHELPPCLLRSHTGVPCPMCGFTRLGVHLLHGDLTHAVRTDLPGVLALILVVVAALGQLTALRSGGQSWLRSRWVPVFLLLAVGGHWALTWATGGLAG